MAFPSAADRNNDICLLPRHAGDSLGRDERYICRTEKNLIRERRCLLLLEREKAQTQRVKHL